MFTLAIIGIIWIMNSLGFGILCMHLESQYFFLWLSDAGLKIAQAWNTVSPIWYRSCSPNIYEYIYLKTIIIFCNPNAAAVS